MAASEFVPGGWMACWRTSWTLVQQEGPERTGSHLEVMTDSRAPGEAGEEATKGAVGETGEGETDEDDRSV